MTFERFNAGFGIQVPEAYREVIGGRENGPRCRIHLDCVDPIRMASKEEGRFVFKIPDFDRSVHRRRSHDGGIKVQPDDAAVVAGVGGYALARAPIPHLQAPVNAAADELGIIELETAYAAGMTRQGANFLAGFDIPDLDRSVI